MNLEANKEALLEAIEAERAYQDKKWGPLSEQKAKSLAGWLTVIESELDESRVAWTRNKGNNAALEELVQVAATWVARVEQGKLQGRDTWLPLFLDNVIELGRRKEHEEPLDRPLEELLGELKHKHLAKCWATIRGKGQTCYFLELGRYIMLALLTHGVVTRFQEDSDGEQEFVMSTCSHCGEEVPSYVCAYNDGKWICDICCVKGAR